VATARQCNNRAAYWPVELSIGTTIDLMVEGQTDLEIDSRPAR
jgi:hypothetical protein